MSNNNKTKTSKKAKTIKKKKNPMFKTVEQMARISGIGENTLRALMDNRELSYIQIGNRRLIADEAIWEWYELNKINIIKKEDKEWQSQKGKSEISVIHPVS